MSRRCILFLRLAGGTLLTGQMEYVEVRKTLALRAGSRPDQLKSRLRPCYRSAICTHVAFKRITPHQNVINDKEVRTDAIEGSGEVAIRKQSCGLTVALFDAWCSR